MRVFLSAFLLPREAQQIDRILLAFAEYAHRTCLEGVTNVFESEDVTYLFTVSIIMLNTDLHNANIRPDRRMKPEQFVKNNQNYGVDYHQTRPLPVEVRAMFKLAAWRVRLFCGRFCSRLLPGPALHTPG
jgi:hypothetical protein